MVALASGVAQAFGRFSYAVLLPSIDRDLLGSYAVAGLIGTVNAGAYLLGTLLVSALARRAAPADLIRGGLGLTPAWAARSSGYRHAASPARWCDRRGGVRRSG